MLGPIEVAVEGQMVDLGPRKQRALLCLLVLHANRVVATDRILDELWGDDAAGKENALWVAISRLRSALEPNRGGHGESTVVLTRDHGYVLQVDADSIDLCRFETAVAETRRLLLHDPAAAVDRVDAALGLWRGTPMEEFHHEEFAQLAIVRLDDLRLEALEMRAQAELGLGRAREQISSLEALHQQYPLRERFVELLMRSLYQAGRQADALRAFDRYRRSIGEELGIEPSPELLRLEEQILLHDPSVAIDRRQPVDHGSSTTVNPFKGLRSFGEEDAADFFGRDRLVSDVMRRIDAGQRLVALVGASGSGKSSVVHAGVVPAIRKGAIEGSERWLVAQMVPGSRPVLELEAALLRSTLDAPDSLSEQLTQPDAGLLRAALRILPRDSRLLLVIDQFEELFALVDDEDERVAFLDLLGPALDDPHGRIVVVLTLRADFYDRPLRYPAFAQRLGDGIVNVTNLTPDELERAVQEPMRRAHVTLEPSLLAALLTDVIGQPGGLPLFQYTLTILFDRREAEGVTLDAYRAIGGVKGALAQRAEDLWSKMNDAESAAARQLFLRLVTISGDREWSRRRVTASELTSLRHNLIATQHVIESFGEHRLLAFDRDQVSGSPTVEVAHEALLTEWPRLHGWIQEARDDVVRHAALVAAMTEWRDASSNADYLLVGQRLADYEAWTHQTMLELTEHEQDFVQQSIAARDDADRGETERAEREIALARRVRRRTAGFVTAILLIGIGAFAVWFAARSPDLPTLAYVHSPFEEEIIFQQQQSAGWDQAQRDHDFDAVDLKPLTDPAGEIEALADSGPELIVVNTDLIEYVPTVAIAHPEIWFVTSDNAGTDLGLPNVTTIDFSGEAAGSYLAGAAAALTTQTGTVGFLGAQQPSNEEFRSGYEAGARAIDPGIEIVSTYLMQTGYFDVYAKPDEGAARARRLYEQGADVVFAAAGNSGNSVPMIADELSATLGRQLWVIGVDTDRWLAVNSSQQEHVLTSMLKRTDMALRTAIDRYLDGELEAGVLDIGFADDAFDLASSGDHLSANASERISSLKDEIKRGAIDVPDVPSGPPTILADADAVIGVTLIADECVVAAPETVRVGNVTRVAFENEADATGSVGLFVGEFPADAVPTGEFPVLGLPARAGGRNETDWRPRDEVPFTIACIDPTTLEQIGAGVHLTVVSS
jgi:basic membrane lipoprotein Med (substrate-binding protein (PBP1-ABC) superfamily)/DNA-binding SARP family transcriptional activator